MISKMSISKIHIYKDMYNVSDLHLNRKWQRLIASVNSKESYQQPSEDQNTELQCLFFQLDTSYEL